MSDHDKSCIANLVPSERRDLAPVVAVNPLVARGLADLAQGQPHNKPSLEKALFHYKCGVEWLDQYADDKAITEFDKAIQLFDEAIRFDPDSATSYLQRGKAWWDKNEASLADKRCRRNAIHDFDQAIRLDPKCVIAYVQRAKARFDGYWPEKAVKDFLEAIRLFDEAIRLDPSNISIFIERAKAWHTVGLTDIARKNFQALRLDPASLSTYDKRELAWTLRDLDNAIQDYTQAIGLNPKSARLYYLRGRAWDAKYDYDKAIRDFDEAIRLDPNHACLYYRRGAAWDANDDYHRAIKDFDEAIRLDPETELFYHRRGEARCTRKDYNQAIIDFEQAIGCNPDSSRAYVSLAWLLATCPEERVRDGKLAIELATKACNQPDWPFGWSVLAAAYAEAGRFDEAVSCQMKMLADSHYDGPAGDEFRQRLELYKQKKPFRESP